MILTISLRLLDEPEQRHGECRLAPCLPDCCATGRYRNQDQHAIVPCLANVSGRHLASDNRICRQQHELDGKETISIGINKHAALIPISQVASRARKVLTQLKKSI